MKSTQNSEAANLNQGLKLQLPSKRVGKFSNAKSKSVNGTQRGRRREQGKTHPAHPEVFYRQTCWLLRFPTLACLLTNLTQNNARYYKRHALCHRRINKYQFFSLGQQKPRNHSCAGAMLFMTQPLKQLPHVSLQLYNIIHVWQPIWGHASI